MLFWLRHSYPTKFKFLFLPMFVFLVVIRHINDNDSSQILPRDV